MASNNARRKPANVDAPFGRVSLVWVSQWQGAGISKTAINVMNCFASNLYTDESGRICTWFPANEMAERLGVAERTIFKAVGLLKQRGFLKEKKRACYGRCAEYWFMPNNGTLKQPKEKALTGAAANAEAVGVKCPAKKPDEASPNVPPTTGGQMHADSHSLPNSVVDMKNGANHPANSMFLEDAKHASSRNSMTLEQFEALKRGGAFKSGSPNV